MLSGFFHYLLTLRRGVLANQELLAGNGAVLGRTGSVGGNLLLPWCVTAWGTGRLGTDLGSLRSWCPEAGGAFRLGLAGPCPFLGAVGKVPWGSRLRAGCYLCPDGGSACCGDSQRAASCPCGGKGSRNAPESSGSRAVGWPQLSAQESGGGLEMGVLARGQMGFRW